MNYKGAYDGSVNYAVGDVAVYTDGIPYVMHKDAPAGVPCHNVLYWERVPQPLADTVVMFHSMITAMNAAISGATEGALIAPEYTKTTYSKGDLRRHDGKLYKAKQNIGTAENWTASHWEQTTVGEEIAAANTAIATIPDNINDEAITLTSGDHDYLITVDTTGEDPELAVTLITEGAGT